MIRKPADLGNHLFTFAVISDTHVNPKDDTCNSPFPVNARANRRFRHVVSDLNQRDIEFVVHLGDLIHPVPETGKLYQDAAATYRNIVSDLQVPIHHVPGNHDIGDTPVEGAPASPTTPDMISAWKAEFGPQWQALSHQGLRLLMINAQLINSGLPDEARQRDWLEAELKKDGDRVMLMLHHPPYICFPEEPNHYDNTDQPGRDWVLGLIESSDIEAVFAGHAHNFWYDRYGNADYYLAPSTSFVRQDYAEMHRCPPPASSEAGRDDRAKLGYFLVSVHEHGHSVQIIRTHGAEKAPETPPQVSRMCALTPRQNPAPLIGFDLRQNWAEICEVPPSGGLDEFDRKAVRNDYPLLALIEMGIRDIRIPLADLRDPIRKNRLRALCHLGLRPTLFSFGVPSETDLALIQSSKADLADWEITIDWQDLERIRPNLIKAHKVSGLPLYLSRMRSKGDIPAGAVYYHVINHGFATSDTDQLAELGDLATAGVVGAVYRLGTDLPVSETLQKIDTISTNQNLRASVHLRGTGENPALEPMDEDQVCERVLEALETCRNRKSLRLFYDCLMDHDRGYLRRKGALDRCGNPGKLLDIIRTAHLSID